MQAGYFLRLLTIVSLLGALSASVHAADVVRSAASAPESQAPAQENSVPPLSAADFTVALPQQSVALMQPWDDRLAAALSVTDNSDYVGQSPADNGSYKYYRHALGDVTLFTSNLDWDKQQRDINAYRIVQITLHSPALSTARGIHIGSSGQALLNAYGNGTHQLYQDIQRRCYYLHGMELVFTLQQQSVSGIALVWSGR